MHISARTDYAVRALLTLAAAGQDTVTGQALAAEQQLPQKFLEAILADLRRAGLVRSRRGPVGGYSLSRPATEIPIGEIVRAVDGPLAVVRGERPEQAVYAGAAEHLGTLWVALRAAVRSVLDDVTLAQVLSGELPAQIQDLLVPRRLALPLAPRPRLTPSSVSRVRPGPARPVRRGCGRAACRVPGRGGCLRSAPGCRCRRQPRPCRRWPRSARR